MEFSGSFNIMGEEKIKLDGKYEIQSNIINEQADIIDDICDKQNVNNQAVFIIGNVLKRTDTEGIDDLIKTFIRYTYEPCDDLDLDLSVREEKQMRWGTICPTRKVLFIYKNKIFIAYGRYIFGYDHNCVVINREGTECSYNKIDEEDGGPKYKLAKKHKLTNDEITLLNPDPNSHWLAYEYTFSFLIYDKDTEVVDAFGLYH